MKRTTIVAGLAAWAILATTPSHANTVTFQFSGSAAGGTATNGSDLMGGTYHFGADPFQPFTNESWGVNFTEYAPPAGFEATSLSITFSGLPSGTTIQNNGIETGFGRSGINPFGGG